jgi:2-oxoglutarate ferredoxin oxidoreductase subunit alpha
VNNPPKAGTRVLIEGNYATAEGAIAGGCRAFFGYPITPQSQIPEYMSWRLEQVGGVFVQAESEVASINMVYGAAAAGARVMTTSSSPGISLMQEGLSYILGAELPCVLVNMVRGGPGLGNIAPAQSDYWLSTRGAGHGDGRPIVYAPYSVQELHDMTADAFAVAERYRLPVMIQGDAILATMMEPCLVRIVDAAPLTRDLGWTVGGGLANRERNVVNSLWTNPPVMEAVNTRMAARMAAAAEAELRWEEMGAEEPQLVLCAYGIMARVCETVVEWGAEKGLRLRLLRPKTLVPFPYAPLRALAAKTKHCMAVELSLGQLVDDVRLAAGDRCEVSHFGRAGGPVLTPEDVLAHVEGLCR